MKDGRRDREKEPRKKAEKEGAWLFLESRGGPRSTVLPSTHTESAYGWTFSNSELNLFASPDLIHSEQVTSKDRDLLWLCLTPGSVLQDAELELEIQPSFSSPCSIGQQTMESEPPWGAPKPLGSCPEALEEGQRRTTGNKIRWLFEVAEGWDLE